MKIAFFIEHISNGGAERVITNLANSFAKHNHEVIMITTIRRLGEYSLSENVRRFTTEGNAYHTSKLIGPFRRLYRLRSILKKEKPQYLVSFLNSALYHGVLTTRGLKTKSIISVRNDPNFDYQTILQKILAIVIIDKKTYELDTDGSLKGYTPKKKSSKKKSSDKSATSDKSGTSTAKKSVALTFDDGPSSFTDRLLDCLEENNAKATFFMVGTEIASFPDEVKRMKKLGCELGNHTYDHKDLATLSSDEISSEIARVDEQLVNLTGEGASVVRPPYGSVNDTVKSTVGTPMILWSIDTLDWKTQDVESTVEEVMNNVKDGSIILMHDIFSTSVDAAEILIPQLIEEGYQLVTVHELASLHQTELSTGVTYGEFNRIK